MIEFRAPRGDEKEALYWLWREAFGESEEFLELFFSAAYDPARCLVAMEDGGLAAMLYWFDCEYRGGKMAYLYGVATAQTHRGRGLATALMDAAHERLRAGGYAAAVLVPAQVSLFRFYEKRGYRTAGFLRERTVAAGEPIPLRELTAEQYAPLRRKLLPPEGIVQEGENLRLLAGYGRFFGGDGWCAVYTPGERPVVVELLGDQNSAAGLLAALGIPKAIVRSPGTDRPFAMVLGLKTSAPEEVYFALAFD